MAKNTPASEPAAENSTDLADAAPEAAPAASDRVDVVELESLPADSSEHAEAMPSLLADGSRQHPDAELLVKDQDGDPRDVHFAD